MCQVSLAKQKKGKIKMKKIVIALSAIVMATVASAATVKWNASGVYERGSTTVMAGSSYMAYFVDSATLSRADMLATYYDSETKQLDLSFLSTVSAANGYSNTFRENANTGAGLGASQGGTLTTAAGNSEAWTGYLVIVDATSLDDATYAFITDEVTKSTGANGQQANIGFASLSGTQTASNWYAAAPEPTSGLLMLVGLAGLALRRRRA